MSTRRDLTKGQKRELRRIVGLAHERELEVALTALEEQFRSWRAGEIEPDELNDAIHAFHQGPSRELWVRYISGPIDCAAQVAVHRGVVAEHEVGSIVVELLRPYFKTEE